MEPVLVTGATGLIGSNICKVLLERGHAVRALVRPGSEMGPLATLGVELVEGDIRHRADVKRAVLGTSAVINSAALLGGPDQERGASYATNYEGSISCYYAGRPRRVVELVTSTFFNHDTTLREDAELANEFADDPYTLSKGAAYVEAKRLIEEGDDIVFVQPGGTFGPSPTPNRALSFTFNSVLLGAIRGQITEYLGFPGPWVRAEDVARCAVAALEIGERGDMYLAFGREEARPLTDFLNQACEIAGVDHRVAEIRVSSENEGDVKQYGETVVALAEREWPTPWFDNSRTREVLDYRPVDLRSALEETVAWLRELGEIS